MTWLITGLFKFPGGNFKEVWLFTIPNAEEALAAYDETMRLGVADKSLYGVSVESWECGDRTLLHADYATRFLPDARHPNFRYAIRHSGDSNFECSIFLRKDNTRFGEHSLMDKWLTAYGQNWTDGVEGQVGSFLHWKDRCGDYATGTLAARLNALCFVDMLPDNTGAVRTVAIKQRHCKSTLADLRDADNTEKREALAEIEASISKVDSAITGYEEEITCKEAELTQMTAELGNAEKELKELTARRDSIKEQLAAKK